jgi:hypothetical protein
MTDHGDQLREAFETHESLAPDAAAVYDRVRDLAKTYHRRRRGVQAAGGAVLGAGLIAGGIQLPSLLQNNSGPAQPTVAVAPAAPAAKPTVSTPPSDAQNQKAWDAYFQAGYGYDDAVKLAKIWHEKADIGQIKAEAGRKLLAGEKLPIKPGPKTPANPGTTKEEAQVTAFFAAGYDYNDAVKLAKLWHTADPYHAKILGGKKLLAGGTLPIRP